MNTSQDIRAFATELFKLVPNSIKYNDRFFGNVDGYLLSPSLISNLQEDIDILSYSNRRISILWSDLLIVLDYHSELSNEMKRRIVRFVKTTKQVTKFDLYINNFIELYEYMR